MTDDYHKGVVGAQATQFEDVGVRGDACTVLSHGLRKQKKPWATVAQGSKSD